MRRLLGTCVAVFLGLFAVATPAGAAPDPALSRQVSGPFTGTSVFDFQTSPCSFVHQVYNASYTATDGGTGSFNLNGCVSIAGNTFNYMGIFKLTTPNGAVVDGTVAGPVGSSPADGCNPNDQPASLDFTLTLLHGTAAFHGVIGTIHLTGLWCSPATPNVSGPISGDLAGAVGRDTARPSCTLTSIIAGPPKQLQITALDTGSGLKSIQATKLVNSTITIPRFATGTHIPVFVTATKTDPNQPSQVELTVKDVAGNTTVCDPVLVTLHRGRGHSVTVHEVDGAEHLVTVRNGFPGLRRVYVRVNGEQFVVRVARGEERSLDIAGALRPGTTNTVRLTGQGTRTGAADVIIWDGNGSI